MRWTVPYIRLYESTESEDPVSQWSAEVSFDEAISLPRVVRDGRFRYGKRFGEPEKFRFPPPIGEAIVVLAAQDEVCRIPYFLKLKDMDVKIGGNEIDRLRRWYRQGKLSKSRGLVPSRFPKTASPRQVARMIRRGKLRRIGTRFAAPPFIMRGNKQDDRIEVRYDVIFPSLLPDQAARIGALARFVRDRADGGALRQTFSARYGRAFSPRRDPAGRPPGHLERPEVPRHPPDSQNCEKETPGR